MPIKYLIDKVCDGIKNEELTLEAIEEPLKKAFHRYRIKKHPAVKNTYTNN